MNAEWVARSEQREGRGEWASEYSVCRVALHAPTKVAVDGSCACGDRGGVESRKMVGGETRVRLNAKNASGSGGLLVFLEENAG